MKNIIITPTFIDHFPFIISYLESFSKYASGEHYIISFIISQDEKKKFSKIIKNFNFLPIDVLYFEDILQEFNVDKTPKYLLEKYGKFSYQTIKKFYAMLHYGKESRFLVLDSESMVVTETNIDTMFEKFFSAPFISYSTLKQRLKTAPLITRVVDNNSYLGLDNGIWCLENFIWYYDYKILHDLFNDYGTPFEIIDKIHKHHSEKIPYGGVFEIELYQNYIYKHHKKYGYKIINIDKELEKCIPLCILNDYKNNFYNQVNGNCGLLERCIDFVNMDNVKYFANFFKKFNFNIIRCDHTTISNYFIQQRFFNIVKPNIMAASQEHAFGINNSYFNLLLCCKFPAKIKKHINRIKRNKIFSLKNTIEIVSILIYGVRSIFEIFGYNRKIKKILNNRKF